MKIVAAMITAGEESLEAAVASVRPHVDAVVAIVTREVPSHAEHDRFSALFDEWRATSEHFPLGEDGEVEWERADFSAARAASFDLARERGADAIVWLDSDDEVVGAENLRPTLERFDRKARVRLMMRYEYAVGPGGEVLVEQWRERAVWADLPYSWKRPVHEGLTADDGDNGDVKVDVVTWRHLRDHATRTERNLRILQGHAERLGAEAESDPWLRLNLGLELQRSNRFEEALPHFEAYVRLSGWDEERALACVHASDATLATRPWGPGTTDARKKALAWALRAREFAAGHGWREHVFQEARVRAIVGINAMGVDPNDRKELERCRDALREYLDGPPSVSALAVKARDRLIAAPELLRVVSETLGDWSGAVAACDRLLAATRDPVVEHRRRRYGRLAGLARGERQAGLDVAIVCGATPEKWDPAIVAEKGMGGSETAVVEVSRRLAAAGHVVRVVADCPEVAVHDGVLWLPSVYRHDVGEPDVAVAWRDASLLDDCEGAHLRLVWAHDLGVMHVTSERLARADRVMGVSAWHCEHLRTVFGGLPQQKMFRTRNGIDPRRFEDAAAERDPHKAIWSSSPDRGLAVLLDLWPRIREQVPDATLDVCYGFGNIDKVLEMTGDLNLAYVASRCRRGAELPGVTLRGRVDQRALARLMLGAGVLAYCTPWKETSCITCMEAQAAGMRIVTSDLAALSETVGDRGTLLPGDYLTPAYQEAFVTAVVDAMLVPGDADRKRSMAYARENFSWDGVVAGWEGLFEKLLGEREGDELPEYQADPAWLATQR